MDKQMERYLDTLVNCIKNKETLTDYVDRNVLDKNEDYYSKLAQNMFYSFAMKSEYLEYLKEQLNKLHGLILRDESSDNFNIRVKGPGKYIKVNYQKIIIGPYLDPITYDI